MKSFMWFGGVALVAAVILWCGSFGGDAAAQERGLKRIELTKPGEYSGSDCIFVMTKDITSEGTGFSFDGKNYIVDLGGHTLTFNTKKYVPKLLSVTWLRSWLISFIPGASPADFSARPQAAFRRCRIRWMQ